MIFELFSNCNRLKARAILRKFSNITHTMYCTSLITLAFIRLPTPSVPNKLKVVLLLYTLQLQFKVSITILLNDCYTFLSVFGCENLLAQQDNSR